MKALIISAIAFFMVSSFTVGFDFGVIRWHKFSYGTIVEPITYPEFDDSFTPQIKKEKKTVQNDVSSFMTFLYFTTLSIFILLLYKQIRKIKNMKPQHKKLMYMILIVLLVVYIVKFFWYIRPVVSIISKQI